MATTDKLFAGPIPEIYDRYLVPLIFKSYACDLAERAFQVRPQRVLETAAGTGVLTRALALRLPAEARIVATDLNQPMLDYAAQRSPGDGRITWRQANALALPFDDQAFDVVACQFGVMFFPDRTQGYREACRVLKPGGHFFFNVWDHISANEFADVVTQALAKLFRKPAPLLGQHPAWVSRRSKGQRGARRSRLCLDLSGNARWHKQGAFAARCCDRLLSGNSAAE